MAILHDVEVTISAKGNKLPEYDDDAEEPGPSNMVTKYIEALTGANFQIHYNIKPMFRLKSSAMSIDVIIDGEYMDSHILHRDEDLKHLSRIPLGAIFTGFRRIQKDSWTLQAFSFAEIKTSEENAVASDPALQELVSKLGSIRIEVHHVKIKGPGVPSTDFGKLRALDALPEKALKGQALSHRASLGPLQRIPSPKVTEVEYINGLESPSVVFNFKYRSRKSLQGMLVIPRTPSPVPLEQRPIDELTREEALELLRRRSIQVKPEVKPTATLKRQHDDFDPERNDDEEYMALLASARSQKVARVQKHIDVIDLLDD
ncbi:MAG: hypothetical protein FRX48_05743 [Lasallia pustulata]|uniref:DUF7918 domain-containing protein n=1 Tax=Lasallia pustulata TaxID=136370 RepID=A0A5M8PP86_9LECA|nr:MAG: hypothetical protein FRX48_05743 [Lasallia pustulata]